MLIFTDMASKGMGGLKKEQQAGKATSLYAQLFKLYVETSKAPVESV